MCCVTPGELHTEQGLTNSLYITVTFASELLSAVSKRSQATGLNNKGISNLKLYFHLAVSSLFYDAYIRATARLYCAALFSNYTATLHHLFCALTGGPA